MDWTLHVFIGDGGRRREISPSNRNCGDRYQERLEWSLTIG